MVLQRLLHQLQRLGGTVAAAHIVSLLLHAVQQGAGKGRRAHAHVAGGDHGLQPLTADVHLYGVIRQDVAVDVAQADGALAAGLQNDGGETLALGLEVGDHGAAGDPAHQFVALIDLHTGAHDAAIHQCDGRDLPGQTGHIGEVAIHVSLEVALLLFQRGTADVVALLGGEADGELGQRHGEDGDLTAVGGGTHLMAVQGQGCLHTQGIAGTQTGGTRTQLHQTVPQPRGVGAADVDLIAQRLAGVAGLGHAGLVTLQRYDAQRVLHGLGQLLAAVETHQQLLALGALHGDGRPLLGDIGDGAVEAGQRGAQMHQILLRVGGVHHQQIVVRFKHIEVGIVHGAAVLIGDDAVLCQTHIQCRHVAGQHVLQKGLTLRALNEQSAHVGHIEQTAHLPGIQVLGNNAGGVLNGHLPSAEVHHFRTGGHMDVIQLGTLQLAHTFFLLQDHGSFFGQQKRTQNRLSRPCAPVELPERFPPDGRLHLRWSGVAVRPFRSIVRNRSFCLRASAFPFGAATAISPDPIVRSICTCTRQNLPCIQSVSPQNGVCQETFSRTETKSKASGQTGGFTCAFSPREALCGAWGRRTSTGCGRPAWIVPR